jgi:hypothetical protein
MITITATIEEEARDLREVLAKVLPPEWGYRIFLHGTEFASRPAGPKPLIDPRQARLRQYLLAAGPHGITAPQLRARLEQDGLTADRDTVHRWLETDADAGLVTRITFQNTASGWVWSGQAATGEAAG